MSQEEHKDQVPLNGAYYGPSVVTVPSHDRHHQPPNRGRSSCLISTIITFIVSIIVILGLAMLIFWLVVRPTTLKFYAVTADLTHFDLTNTTTNNGRTTLNYNLTLNIAVRNPNKRIGIYYDSLEATAYYDDRRFGWQGLPGFYQGHKNTTELRIAFEGHQVVVFGAAETSRFDWEKKMGVFYVDVKLYSTVRFKIGAIKSKRYRPEIECNLRIPLASNGTSLGRQFESRRCDVDF